MISEIKKRITLQELAAQNGYHKGRNIARYRGGDNPTSLMIGDDTWYDFKTHQGGDVIDFYAVINNLDNHTAIMELAEKTGIQRVETQNLNHQAAFYHSKLQDEHRKYLHDRGIRDETINKYLIGYCEKDTIEYERDGETRYVTWRNRITIPYWKNGNVVYFIARALDPDDTRKYMKMPATGTNQNVIWGLDTLAQSGEKLIIAEGAFDALSAAQDGYRVLSPMAGQFSAAQKAELVEHISNTGSKPILCLDYDPISETGQRAAWKLAFYLFTRYIDCDVVNFQGGDRKVDLNDKYASGSTVEEITRAKVPFIETYIKQADERAMYKLARERSLAEYQDLINPALFKAIQKAPPDSMIADEIMRKNKFVYHDKLDWYQYNDDKGRWDRKTDNDIKERIDKTLKRFSTGRIINSVLTVMKAKCNYVGDFDTDGDYINVKNGMLNLKTGYLHNHASEFMSASQMSYEYDPDAKAPRWDNFISEITQGDESRRRLLQEMFGYCLTTDTKYQKMFFLMGQGSNGKSVLLNILEDIIGHQNVGHVPLSGMIEDFQRILLHGKKVNVVAELKTRIEHVNQILKAIVAGEPIQGAYKYKAHIEFKPYCKIICAGNEMFTADDTTYGFKRRLLFCNFPAKFEGENRDLNIIKKLRAELPGVLNWSIEGLKRLERNGQFTESSDQAEMIQIFSSLSDNTHDFIEDMNAFEFKQKGQLYQEYVMYCSSSNSRPMSIRKFYEKIRNDYRFKEWKTNGIRGYRFTPGPEQTEIIQGTFE